MHILCIPAAVSEGGLLVKGCLWKDERMNKRIKRDISECATVLLKEINQFFYNVSFTDLVQVKKRTNRM